jgi:hypothetical protein
MYGHPRGLLYHLRATPSHGSFILFPEPEAVPSLTRLYIISELWLKPMEQNYAPDIDMHLVDMCSKGNSGVDMVKAEISSGSRDTKNMIMTWSRLQSADGNGNSI